MDTTAVLLAIAIIAVSLIGMVSSVVPRIRDIKQDRIRAKAIDEFHKLHP